MNTYSTSHMDCVVEMGNCILIVPSEVSYVYSPMYMGAVDSHLEWLPCDLLMDIMSLI